MGSNPVYKLSHNVKSKTEIFKEFDYGYKTEMASMMYLR